MFGYKHLCKKRVGQLCVLFRQYNYQKRVHKMGAAIKLWVLERIHMCPFHRVHYSVGGLYKCKKTYAPYTRFVAVPVQWTHVFSYIPNFHSFCGILSTILYRATIFFYIYTEVHISKNLRLKNPAKRHTQPGQKQHKNN